MKSMLFVLALVIVACAPVNPDVLSTDEEQALEELLRDEYRAETIYQRVIEDHGLVRPFSNIINAERKHSDELITLFERYGLSVPDNEWYDAVPRFTSVDEACAAGVTAEIENAALYDEWLSVIEHEDIRIVFERLRDASQYNHLPAFERCGGRT